MPEYVYYTSEDESFEVKIDTDDGGITTITDLDASESEDIQIDKEGEDTGKEDLLAGLTPGFRNGKIAMLIARLIRKALT